MHRGVDASPYETALVLNLGGLYDCGNLTVGLQFACMLCCARYLQICVLFHDDVFLEHLKGGQ